jgi:hypothetical protein
LTFERDVGRGAAEHLAPDHPPCVLHGNPALRLFDEDHGRDDREADHDHGGEEEPALGDAQLPELGGEAGDDLREDQERHAVADAAVGDQLAEPHDHGGAGGHGDHHDHGGADALVVDQLLVAAREQVAGAGQGHDAGRLEDRQRQREVAGVLGDLGLAGLALLLEGLQPRDHHHQQLQDDARRDVRHDPEREDGQLEERATGEQVDQVVDPALLRRLVEAVLHVRDVHAGRRDLGPQAEDGDDQQDEQQLLAQVRCPECVGEGAQHVNPLLSSAVGRRERRGRRVPSPWKPNRGGPWASPGRRITTVPSELAASPTKSR